MNKSLIWASVIEDIVIMGLWIELATYFGMWWLALIGVLCVAIIKKVKVED